jgi:VRR-NUC domain-containing protein
MTQLRHCKCDLSNWADKIFKGIGHRGSSFADLDFIAHDKNTHRFLAIEYKRPGENLSEGQRILLADLALEARFTVWFLLFGENGQFGWIDMAWYRPQDIQTIELDQLQERYAAWWVNRYRVGLYMDISEEVMVRTD